MNTTELSKVDCFCNLVKASEISCPVFLIHGMCDEVIPFNQVQELAKQIKVVNEWFPSKGNHSNIVDKYRNKFYSKIKLFCEHLNYYEARKAKQDLRETFLSKYSKSVIKDDNTSNISPDYLKNKAKLYSEENQYFMVKNSHDNKIESKTNNYNNNYYKFSHDRSPFSFRKSSNEDFNDAVSNGKSIEFQHTKDLEYQMNKIQNYNG